MDHALLIKRNRPDTRIITFLRKPADRVLSDFRYQRTPAHPPYREFIEKYPTLDDYLADPASQNKMSKILAPAHIDPRNMEALIEYLDENLTFIGVQDAYPLSFSLVFSLLGKDRHPRLHERRTEKTEFNQIELTAELENRIHSCNDLDLRLFRHYRDVLVSIREEWYQSGSERVRAQSSL
jgi:hypothetical protein